tara:strand:+ start:699 stop:1670 length:972 start_codon:yes stop_codon:yes gene_type:complete
MFKILEKTTIRQAVQTFLKDKIESSEALAQQTKSDYAYTLDFYVLRYGTIPIKKLTFQKLSIIVDNLRETGISKGTALKSFTMLKRAVTYFCNVKNINSPNWPKVEGFRDTQSASELSSTSFQEFSKLFKWLANELKDKPSGIVNPNETRITKLYFSLFILFNTGMRVQEFNRLLYADIDSKHKKITIRPFSSKKGYGRTISVSNEVISLLRRNRFSETFVSPYMTDATNVSKASVKMASEMLAFGKQAKIKKLTIRPSSIRKLFTTIAASKDVSLSLLSSYLGHQSSLTTYKHYVNSSLLLRQAPSKRALKGLAAHNLKLLG